MKSRREFLLNSSLFGLASILGPAASLLASERAVPVKQNSKTSTGGKSGQITILYTTDIHGQLNVHDEFFWEDNKPVYRKRGGLAHLKTMVERIKSENPAGTILVDGGDYFHGSAVASMTEGEALIPIFNNLGYDLMLPGNWEVVYKKKQMLYDMGRTTAAKICANMWHHTDDADNGELIFPPYWVKYVAGVKIGFIGYTDHLIPKRQSPAYSKGIRFTHANHNLAKYVSKLREEEGCAVVMVVTHMGLAQQVALSNDPACEGVDLIMGADTHERIRKPIPGKYTSVIECGAFGSFLGKIDLTLDEGKLKKMDYALLDVDPQSYPADQEMQELIDKANAPFKRELSTVIGYTSAPLVRYFVLETPMDNLITDAVHEKFRPDITVSNGFRFCQPLAASSSSKAAITKEFLWNMLPVDSEVKQGTVTGAQIEAWLERELENAFAKDVSQRFGGWFVRFSGMEVNFTIGKEKGHRINEVKIGGKPLEASKEYSIIACEREGDPDTDLCRISGVKNPKKLGVFLHPIIEEYLAKHGTVAPRQEGRAIATDEAQTLLTQVKGIPYEFS